LLEERAEVTLRPHVFAIALASLLAATATPTPAHADWPGFHYSGNQSPPSNGLGFGNGGILSGQIDLYVIYYGGWSKYYVVGGSWSAAHDESIISTYYANLGTSSYFKIAKTYYDQNNHRPTGLNLAGAWTVPQSSTYTIQGTFPVGRTGSAPWTPSGYSGNLFWGSTLQQLVHDQIKAHSIAHPERSVFLVLPAPDIFVWDISGSGGPINDACGFHNVLKSSLMTDLPGFAQPAVWATVEPITSGCSVGDTSPFDYPNSPHSDLEINESTHELFEAISDPYPFSGWTPEIGDLCGPQGGGLAPFETAWGPSYATTNSVNGSPAHATIHVGTGNYVVQRMWVNSGGGYCDFHVRTPGDFDGDGKADLVTLDAAGSAGNDVDQFVVYSVGDGTFTSGSMGTNFNPYAANTNTKTVTGDFNRTGKAGLAAVAGSSSSWNTVPELSPNLGSTGYFLTTTNTDFNAWVAPGQMLVAGDFDGDGYTDLATISSGGYIAWIRNLNSYFTPGAWSSTGYNYNGIGQFAYAPFVLTGDFNGDGRSDIVALGSGPWSVPLAISNGDGTWNFLNYYSVFNYYASQPGAHVVVGDFDGDGLDDLLATGPASQNYVVLAFSNGDGTFTTTSWSSNFNAYASQPGVRVYAGDYDGDGRADLTAQGGAGWQTIPIAFARGSGSTSYFSTPSNQFSWITGWFTGWVGDGHHQVLSSWL
jgi:hypothetical protein